MKFGFMIAIAGLLMCGIFILGMTLGQPETVLRDAKKDSSINGYRGWHRVNQEPVLMEPQVSALCINAVQYGPNNPHVSKFITVFVNDIGRAAMTSKKPTPFPVGSIIVKEKFEKGEQDRPELLTVMVKREKGFDPGVGDWEFFTASTESLLNRDPVTHCVSCHQAVPESDFVFRSYLVDR